MTDLRISTQVDNQWPDFVKEAGPKLINFVRHYHKWMEQEGYATDALKSLLQNQDVDYTDDIFLEQFHNEFLVYFPKHVLVDRRRLVKSVREFYRSKGTENSYKILFRAIFNENVDFYYPGVDILRASDGRWIIERSLKVFTSIGDDIFDTLGNEVVGSTSGARSRIENVISYISNQTLVHELFLSRIIGTFQVGERITVDGSQIAIVSEVMTYDGKYSGTYGFLSWDKFLQDNFFYQEFSYVLRSGIPITNYEDVVKKLVHPAGTKLFGEFQFVDVLQTSIVNVDFAANDGLTTHFNYIVDMQPQVDFIQLYTPTGDSEGLLVYELNLNLAASVAAPEDESIVHFLTDSNGSIRVANTADFSTYSSMPFSAFTTWRIEHFTSGTGVIGTGTRFQVELANTDTIKLKDNTATDANSINSVETIQSNTTLILALEYPHGDLANGSIIRYS